MAARDGDKMRRSVTEKAVARRLGALAERPRATPAAERRAGSVLARSVSLAISPARQRAEALIDRRLDNARTSHWSTRDRPYASFSAINDRLTATRP